VEVVGRLGCNGRAQALLLAVEGTAAAGALTASVVLQLEKKEKGNME
jgi:hypothetical protein